ncbi:MAG: homogentisate 1,2-dioxygenase [bacterium]|nr:homogentisate 1,2-dioxygenase [bacterium]
MPFYVRQGELPERRHTQFRKADGSLHAEELFSTKGFESVYALLYHLYPPTATLNVTAWDRPLARFHPNDPLLNRHLRAKHIQSTGNAVEARVPLLGNDEIVLSIAQASEPMTWFYRNATGDELLFIHWGEGCVETPLGEVAYRQHDYVLIPCGTTYRMQPRTPTRMLVYESSGAISIPKKYRNAFGQLEEHAPYYERDFRPPSLRPPVDQRGAFELRVSSRGRSAIYTLQNHPFDVVGWDGYCYPYAFNAADFAPQVGRLHLPPPVHQVFEAPGAAFCLFAPRPFDFDRHAVPIPYNHSSVDCDEVLYYVSGNFMSRRGIEEGSITLHVAGAWHGPQPGAVEASLGAAATDELAVMVDTFRPLRLSEQAFGVEDAAYFKSWASSEVVR